MSRTAEAEALAHELFRTDAGRRDPYPRLHRLRAIAPVHRSEVARAWLLTRYDDCSAALRDPRFGKRFDELLDKHSDTWREHESMAQFSRMLVQLDAPAHTRLRKKVMRTFTPKRIEGLRPRIAATVAELLEESTAQGTDLLNSLAFRLPITVIGDMFGIDRADLAAFRGPAMDLTVGLEPRVTREQRQAANAATRFFDGYFSDLLAQRRANPGDDLLSAMVTDDGDPLTEREILDLCALLLVAGFETTTNVISSGLLTLHDQPEQFAILRSGSHPDRVADEFLRHQASLQLVNRVALEDVAIGDQVIPEGDQIFVMLGAANRDPEVFDDPDRLDFTRERPKHLTFGGGIHHCLGAALARLELEVLLEQLSARFTAVEMPGERPRFRSTLTFRAMESLPLRLRPAGERVGNAAPARPTDDAAWRDAQRAQLEAEPPPLSAAELTGRVSLLETQPLFSGWRASDLVSLATTAYVLTFSPGDELVAQGAESQDAFVILEGSADVLIDGTHVATLSADDLVGERGVVTDTPRAATVVATDHIATLVLSRARFRAVLDADPAAAATMRAVIAARYPDAATAS